MAPRRFRRRFLIGAAVLLVVLVGAGIGIGMTVSHGPWTDGGGRRGGPGMLFGFAAFVGIVASIATVLAYRRISRPVADLLGAAERLGQGDYDVHVEPDGPRELRSLTSTFNDLASRLAATDEQRRRFLADVTHELRTPLAVLQSGIEAQIDNIHPRDDHHLGSLLEETQLLGRLVDDLHTLALADAGKLALHRERAHPAALVAEAVESHLALAARKDVRIVVTAQESIPTIDVDRARIRQVLANLLSNAVRHAPAGTEVTVRVHDADGRVAFTVTDAGPGIPAEQLEHLFERFSRSADSRGSGLGLSIARDLVQAHAGNMRAWNEAGGGAAVSFDVPAARTES
jgi:signal transduction histidine kinase